MNLYKHAGDVFAQIKAGHWSAMQKVNTIDVTTPCHRWDGPRITTAQIEEVKAFFAWSMKETNSETMVHGYLHPAQGWQFLVLPQKGYSSMSVKLIEDHENVIPTMKRLVGDEWRMRCTIHHHCNSGAFQSGTDEQDEIGKEGLHITMGNISSASWSLHSRGSFRKTIAPVLVADWFEIEEAIADLVPVELWDKLIEYRLKTPPKADQAFPEWWKDNVVKVTYPVTTYPGHPGHSYSNSTSDYGRTYHVTRFTRFEADIEELMRGHTLEIADIEAVMDSLREEPYKTIVNSMVDRGMNLGEAIESVQDIKKELEWEIENSQCLLD